MEVELKIGLEDPDALPVLLAALPPPESVVTQRNHYFDDPNGRLRKAGVMLRVREEWWGAPDGPPGRVTLTAKRRTNKKAGVFVADEHEHELTTEVWTAVREGEPLGGQDSRVLDWVRERTGELTGVASIGVLENVRRRILLEGFVLEVDRSTFADGSVDVEVEVETEELERAREVVERVARSAGVETFDQRKGKAARFWARKLRAEKRR